VILTLYNYQGGRAELKEFLGKNKIFALTMPIRDVVKGKAWQSVPVYTHTVNGCFYYRWLNLLGVDGVYTDGLFPGGC